MFNRARPSSEPVARPAWTTSPILLPDTTSRRESVPNPGGLLLSHSIRFAGKQCPSVKSGQGPTVDRWAGKSHVPCHIQHPDRSSSKQQRHLSEISVKGLKVSCLEGLSTTRKEESKTTQPYRNMPLCYSELPS